MSVDWQGVFAAVTTPFADDESLDLPTLEAHVASLVESGVSGLVVLGSLGEPSSLSPSEKRAVIRAAAGAAGERVPVLAGTCETTTRAACHYAVECERMGVAGLLVVPSPHYEADARETLMHLRSIAAAAELPVMVGAGPGVTPAMLVELAAMETVVAVAGVRRVSDLVNALGDRFAIFAGADAWALESALLGARGHVSALANGFPREIVELWQLAAAGRYDEALGRYRRLMPLLRLDSEVKRVQAIKLVLQILGLGGETVRAPRLPLAGPERERVSALVHAALATRDEPAPV